MSPAKRAGGRFTETMFRTGLFHALTASKCRRTRKTRARCIPADPVTAQGLLGPHFKVRLIMTSPDRPRPVRTMVTNSSEKRLAGTLPGDLPRCNRGQERNHLAGTPTHASGTGEGLGSVCLGRPSESRSPAVRLWV